MLSKNPDDRPTARKILQSPFIKRHIMQLLEKTKIKYEQFFFPKKNSFESLFHLLLDVKIKQIRILQHLSLIPFLSLLHQTHLHFLLLLHHVHHHHAMRNYLIHLLVLLHRKNLHQIVFPIILIHRFFPRILLYHRQHPHLILVHHL